MPVTFNINIDNKKFSEQLEQLKDSDYFKELVTLQRNILAESFAYHPSGICTPHRAPLTMGFTEEEVNSANECFVSYDFVSYDEEEPIPVELPQYSIELPVTVDH